MRHTVLRTPAGGMAADIDVHERPVRAVRLVEAQPTLEGLIPAFSRETLDHPTQHSRVIEHQNLFELRYLEAGAP